MTKSIEHTFIALLAAATIMTGAQSAQATGGMNALASLELEATNSQIEKVGFFKKGGKFTNHGVAAIGVGAAAVGGLIGHKISKRRQAQQQHYYAPAPAPVYASGNAHVNWCLSRYRSYDVRSDTYQPYNGPRRYCNSPYN